MNVQLTKSYLYLGFPFAGSEFQIWEYTDSMGNATIPTYYCS